MNDPVLLKRIIEGALMAAGKPLTERQLLDLFSEVDEMGAPELDQIKEALEAIEADSKGRGFELRKVASGYRFQVIDSVAPWVGRLWEEKPQRYSRALLETLALIAYRQPITRGDIEEIRGVAVSSHIIKTLVERDWVRVVGHRDVPGRPAMYATTRTFLDYFNLRNLDELPALADIKDLDALNNELEFMAETSARDGEASLSESDEESTTEEQADAGAVLDDDVTSVEQPDTEPQDDQAGSGATAEETAAVESSEQHNELTETNGEDAETKADTQPL